MSDLTPNLKLFKYDPVADAKQPFSITKAWNNNWDIIDKNAGGVPIGFIYPAVLGIDESDNKYRYLNGQILIQDQYVNFTSWVKSRMNNASSAFCTENEWQSIQANSKLGQCGKFVVDDTNGTIRLPRVINIQGLTDLANCGLIKDESLPNITGGTAAMQLVNESGEDYGCFYKQYECNQTDQSWSGTGDFYRHIFDASRSSSTYQNDAPVQQEAIQYPYVICVNSGVEEAEKPISNYQVNNVYSFGMSQYYKGTMNNASWLRSQGQWNAGTVYTDLYTWIQTQITNNIDGFKLSTAEDITDYDWVLNTENETFRLPIIGQRILVESKQAKDSDPTWYNVYSDGWCEQGGQQNLSSGICTVTFPKTFKDTTYTVCEALSGSNASSGASYWGLSKQTTNVKFTRQSDSSKSLSTSINWQVCGYIDLTTISTGYNLYYYVGDTLQNVDIMNVARIEETLTDINSPSRGYLVESYVNGQSGYRLYSDGFCEQWSFATGNGATITLLKPYSNTNYSINLGGGNCEGWSVNAHSFTYYNCTSTSFNIRMEEGTTFAPGMNCNWLTLGYIS